MNTKRITCLDYARVFAILCVILVHTTERVYHLTSGSPVPGGVLSQILRLSLFALGRVGVPVFLFLTGYLLLDKTYDSEGTVAFYKNKFGCLLFTTELWIVIYYIFNLIYRHDPISPVSLIKSMLFLKSAPFSHLWYMPVILGIYLFVPFLSVALKHIDIKVLYFPFFLAFVYLFVIPVCNAFLKANSCSRFTTLPEFSFSGGIYGFCVILGYLVKKDVFKRFSSVFLIISGFICFCITVFTQYYSAEHGISYYVWYDSATLLIVSLCIFILFSRISLKSCQWIETLARDSFGIYLVHSGLNMIVINRISSADIPLLGSMILSFIVTLAVSWLIVYFSGKERHIRKWLFFQK